MGFNVKTSTWILIRSYFKMLCHCLLFPFISLLERFGGVLKFRDFLGFKYWFVAATLTAGEIFNGVKYGMAESRWFTNGSDNEWLGR